jgi:hypothetical protein
VTLLLLGALGCGTEPGGTLRFRTEWPEGRPGRDARAFLFATVAQDGVTLLDQGPLDFSTAEGFELPSVPHGEALVARLELRASPWANARLLYVGQAGPLSFRAGDDLEVGIEMLPVEDDDAASGDAVRAPAADLVRYIRQPWGTEASGGRPDFAVVGEAGSVPPDTTVIVYTRSDVESADEVTRTRSDADGAFRAQLEAEAFGQPTLVFVGLAQGDLHSDSSTVAGLQALPVRRGEWRASCASSDDGGFHPLVAASDSPEQLRRWITARSTVEFRVLPALGNGNATAPASVEVDEVELVLAYDATR